MTVEDSYLCGYLKIKGLTEVRSSNWFRVEGCLCYNPSGNVILEELLSLSYVSFNDLSNPNYMYHVSTLDIVWIVPEGNSFSQYVQYET